MEKRCKRILALGADIKNRFLMAKDGVFCFGPELGDLGRPENYRLLRKELFKNTGNIKPDIIAYDLHPGYFSSYLAREYSKELSSVRLVPVQHHHAHIASVIEEHKLGKAIIGISFDGTGYGTDGNMWGGEFFVVDKRKFRRLAHFKYIAMPGGQKVISEPWRMVLSILKEKGMPLLKNIKENKKIVLSMISRGINSPLTSGVGRLFDAAAALLGICSYAKYEAEGPLRLEKLCDSSIRGRYNFNILKKEGHYVIDAYAAFLEMANDVLRGEDKHLIATKFHNAFVEVIRKLVGIFSKNFKITDIALSGGVFQNNFLKAKIVEKLESSGYNVYMNKRLPLNDYNISLGQYYVSCSSRKN